MTRDEAITTLREIVTNFAPEATKYNPRYSTDSPERFRDAAEAARVVTAAIAALDRLGALKSEKGKDGFAVAGL